MSEIKTKKQNFGYKRNANGDRDMVRYSKRIEGKTDYNTQKTTDMTDYEQRRVNSLLHVIFKICELSGFWVEERIVLKDRKTGKIWR